MVTRFDINCENFSLYFEKLIPLISQSDKKELPHDVLFKMRRNRLNFFAQLFLLWKCLKKRWWLVVEDENGGLSTEQFVALRESIKKRDYGIPKAENFVSTGTFVLASKEFADTIDYLNRLSVSPAYNFIQRSKKKILNKTAEWHEQMTFVCRFLAHYEANRKKIILGTKIEMAEWLVLIYLYHGNEVQGSPIHKEFYQYSFNSSQTKIKVAFGTLQNRNYIEKIGIKRGSKFKITALGRSFVNDIMSKFVLNS